MLEAEPSSKTLVALEAAKTGSKGDAKGTDTATATPVEEGLPTALQLFKTIMSKDILFNPSYRDLVLVDLFIHLFCWVFFTCLLWSHFLQYLPFNVTFKIFVFGLMSLFAVSTDIWGIIINAVSPRRSLSFTHTLHSEHILLLYTHNTTHVHIGDYLTHVS